MFFATLALVSWSLTLPAQGLPASDVAEMLRIADAQCGQRQYKEAEATYRKVLSVSPDSVAALNGLGSCYFAMGRSLDAARLLSEVVRRDPENRTAQRELAGAFVDLNRFAPAERLLNSILLADSNDKESWFYLGVLMYKNGYFGAADADFEKAKYIPSTDHQRATKIAIYQAVCWVHLDRLKEAEALMTSLAKDPMAQKDPDLLLVFAQLLYDTQRPELALQRIDQALLARPDLAMGYFWKGKVLYRLGRLEEAATAEEQALRMLPEFPYPRSLLVKIYQAQGRTDEAAKQAEWLRAYEDRRSVGSSR